MRRIALVGKNLSSSFSIKFFNEKIKKENIKNIEYVNLEINRIDIYIDECRYFNNNP